MRLLHNVLKVKAHNACSVKNIFMIWLLLADEIIKKKVTC
jgi:hypothetical protein